MRRGARRVARLTHDVFHAVVPWQDGYTQVYRRCNVRVPWGEGSLLMQRALDARFRPLDAPRPLGHGEDPRVFVHEGVLWVLSFSVTPNTSGPRSFLLRPHDGFTLPLQMPDGAFGGKNWAPFSWRGAVYFIHGLDPLAVLRADLETGALAWVHREDADRTANTRWSGHDSGFGAHRCGSQALVLSGEGLAGERLVGAGHRTDVEHGEVRGHASFLYALDLATWRLEFHDVRDPARAALRDPTSLWFDPRRGWHMARTLAPALWERAPYTASEVVRIGGDLDAWTGGGIPEVAR